MHIWKITETVPCYFLNREEGYVIHILPGNILNKYYIGGNTNV